VLLFFVGETNGIVMVRLWNQMPPPDTLWEHLVANKTDEFVSS